jgi:hypothetical protein
MADVARTGANQVDAEKGEWQPVCGWFPKLDGRYLVREGLLPDVGNVS